MKFVAVDLNNVSIDFGGAIPLVSAGLEWTYPLRHVHFEVTYQLLIPFKLPATSPTEGRGSSGRVTARARSGILDYLVVVCSKVCRLRWLWVWVWEFGRIAGVRWKLPELGGFRWVVYLPRLQHIRIEVGGIVGTLLR